MIQTIESDTPSGMLFTDFCEPGDIPDRYGSRKILTCLDCMTGFGIGSDTRLKEIKSDQGAQWEFISFFVIFGPPKVIVVDADRFLKCNVQEDFPIELILIPVYAVERVNQKEIINEGSHNYLNKVQNINSSEKGSLYQWLQVVFFYCMLVTQEQ